MFRHLYLFGKRFLYGLFHIRRQTVPPITHEWGYSKYKEHIHTGDVVAFKTSVGVKFTDRIYGHIIRILTGYQIHHVATVVILGERRFILEAVPPRLRLSLLSERGDFYLIPVTVWDRPDITEEQCETFIDKALTLLGIKYSLTDAIRSYWSLNIPNNNGLQCVETMNNLRFLLTKKEYQTKIPGEYIQALSEDNYPILAITNKETNDA
jgi:hypothetical protein